MRILIDMDGIVADLLEKWLRVYNEEWGESLTKEGITEWDLHRVVNPRCGEAIYSMLDRPAFLDNVKPLPGAIEAVRELREHPNCSVRIVSTPSSYDSARAKYMWCEQVLGVPRREVILMHDKHWLDADVLIDDKPRTLREWKHYRKGRTATIAYPYNRDAVDWIDCDAQDYRDTAEAWATIVAWVKTIAETESIPF